MGMMEPPGDKADRMQQAPLTSVHHLQQATGNEDEDATDALMRERSQGRYQIDSKGKNPALKFKAVFRREDPNKKRNNRQRITLADSTDEEQKNVHLNLHYEKV